MWSALGRGGAFVQSVVNRLPRSHTRLINRHVRRNSAAGLAELAAHEKVEHGLRRERGGAHRQAHVDDEVARRLRRVHEVRDRVGEQRGLAAVPSNVELRDGTRLA